MSMSLIFFFMFICYIPNCIFLNHQQQIEQENFIILI